MIDRYSRPEMAAIWTDRGKLDRWLAVEIAVVDADFNRNTLHDEIEGEDHPEVVLLADQHAHHTGQCAGMDAYTFSYHQVGMGLKLAERQPRA